MSQPQKSKLERAAEICAERAEFEEGMLNHYAAYPEETPEGFESRRHLVDERTFDRDALKAGSRTLVILATYEDEARAFVSGLLKRYQAGQ